MTRELVKWSDELSTGVIWQDTQHVALVEKLNLLHEAILSRRDQAVVKGMIQYLGYYATEHFAIEERYMAELGYPDSATHIAEHKKFKANFEKLRHYYSNPDALAGTMMAFDLNEWIVNHIRKADMALGLFLMGKNEG